MKIKSTKSVILRPIVIGAVALLAGVGLFVYYYFFYTSNASIATYVSCGALVVAGFAFLISTIFIAINQKKKLNVLKNGKDVIAEYISHETNVRASKTNFYAIKYKYELDGLEFIKTSKNEFLWQEVLTLRVAKKFAVRALKNDVVLNCSLQAMFNEHQTEVAAMQKQYDEAYAEIEKMKF